MKRYGLYRRVSTEEQSRPGHVSLEAQSAACERYVQDHGGVIVLSELDVQSGHKENRTGYLRLREAIRRKEIDAVVVWKLDRFGRNFREWLNASYELEQLGVSVESVTDSNDPLTRNIMMSVAEQYLRDLSKNTINGLRFRASKGEWSGAPPVGYKVERINGVSKLAIDPVNAAFIREAFAMAASGEHSLQSISETLKARGLRGRSGHFLSRPALGRILRNPTYRGAIVYGRKTSGKFAKPGPRPESDWIVTEDAHPAIVDRATWDTAQVVLSSNKVRQARVRKSKHLLTGLVYCGVCEGTPGPDGAPRLWRMYGHGTKTPVYGCSRRAMYDACTAKSMGGAKLEREILNIVKGSFSIPSEVRREAVDLIAQEVDSRRSAGDHQRRNLQRELDKHQEKRKELARQRLGLAKVTIPEEVYLALEIEEAQAVTVIERAMASLPQEAATENIVGLMDLLETVVWDDFDTEDWRTMLGYLIARIVVKSRTDFTIIWMEEADVLRGVFAKVSH